MLGLAMIVTIQRLGLLDLTSMTERTNPATSDPSTVTVGFCRDVDDSGNASPPLNQSSRTFACLPRGGTRKGSATRDYLQSPTNGPQHRLVN